MSSANKVALVTGSATGAGAAIALALASRGYNVVINYTRSLKEAEETEAACAATGVETLLFQGDVSKDEDCRAMAKAAYDKWGRIDALVNNAGRTKFVAHNDLDGLNAQDFHEIFAVNTIGPYQMTRAVAPYMKETGKGAVVMISSIAGTHGTGSSIAYVASKGGLNSMTKALARALGPEIRVNAVCPGFIETRWLLGGYGEEKYELAKKKLKNSTPLRAVCQPEDIADAALMFIEGSSMVTGELMIVDGGMQLGR
ncbi:SDR family NAD(P)-dependent oxidoreductase [Sneathiella sp.]|uniref:SDR family NAD(P)-dependent oxidoreductase n=1 Tax=Sneathiella sp. TaxID=1964365 RepID=UPI002FE30CF6